MNSIREVINFYKPMLKEAGEFPISKDFSKLTKEMKIHPDAVRLLSDQDVNEILNTDIQKRTIAQDRIDKNERYKKMKQNNNKCKGRKK